VNDHLAAVLRRLFANGHYSLSGRRLRVHAEVTDLSDEEFDAVYDLMDEVDGDASVLRLAPDGAA
jgi:hypothetical protein